jgi:glycosyltransferase involved in cell wall biosynthesis
LGLSLAAAVGEEALVSIVIVHHMRPALLLQAVGSAVGQDYKNVEIVVVDNGSEGEAVLHELDKVEE